MIMPENNTKKYSKKRTVYLLSGLCVLAAAAGVWGALSSINTPTPEPPSASLENENNQIEWKFTIPNRNPTEAEANNPVKNIPDERTNPTETEVQSTEPDLNTPFTGTYGLPMGTDITSDYSNGEMVRNETSGDWRAHNGIDFGGAEGNNIIAVQDGVVVSASTDSLWGFVVEIDHGKGLVARYCGLSENNKLEKGQKVKMYDIIGTLGNVPIESADGPHLHFEVKVNGEFVDPLAAMNKSGGDEGQ